MATAKERMRIRRNQPTVSRCSFCGKGSDEVRHLIAGPGDVYICDECIALCQQLIVVVETPADAPLPEIPAEC